MQRRFVGVLQQAQRLLELAEAVQADDGANPGAQLDPVEGFDDVVIGAGLEARQP
ncbi:MAG: hypothetical protein ACXWO3_03070 [Isosphaeraceae bacterium]